MQTIDSKYVVKATAWNKAKWFLWGLICGLSAWAADHLLLLLAFYQGFKGDYVAAMGFFVLAVYFKLDEIRLAIKKGNK